MTSLRRLMVVTAVLACAIAYNPALLLGEPAGSSTSTRSAADAAGSTTDTLESLAEPKFPQPGALAYQAAEGDILCAMKVQPSLDAVSARPQDVVMLVDTTASQAGPFFVMQRGFARQCVQSLNDGDRAALWNVNTKAKELTQGLAEK